jgi:hypothetical protein
VSRLSNKSINAGSPGARFSLGPLSICLKTLGAEFLDDEALEAAREDRDECDRNESDEMLVRALEDGVQPPVSAQPGKGSFNHPADARGKELSVSAASNGLEVMPSA